MHEKHQTAYSMQMLKRRFLSSFDKTAPKNLSHLFFFFYFLSISTISISRETTHSLTSDVFFGTEFGCYLMPPAFIVFCCFIVR